MGVHKEVLERVFHDKKITRDKNEKEEMWRE